MSLLPIIYTSVAIFAALMIIIISISYISYKVKVDVNSFPKAEPAAQPKFASQVLKTNSASHSQKIITGKNVNSTVYPITKNPVKNAPPVLDKSMVYQEPVQNFKRPSNSNPRVREEKRRPEPRERVNHSERVKKEKKIESNKPRLEIVRVLSSEKTIQQPKKSDIKKELSKSKADLANLNFFNFYSDIDEGNLNQIQTSSI